MRENKTPFLCPRTVCVFTWFEAALVSESHYKTVSIISIFQGQTREGMINIFLAGCASGADAIHLLFCKNPHIFVK